MDQESGYLWAYRATNNKYSLEELEEQLEILGADFVGPWDLELVNYNVTSSQFKKQEETEAFFVKEAKQTNLNFLNLKSIQNGILIYFFKDDTSKDTRVSNDGGLIHSDDNQIQRKCVKKVLKQNIDIFEL